MTDLSQIIDRTAERGPKFGPSGRESDLSDRDTADAFDRALADSAPKRDDERSEDKRADKIYAAPAIPAQLALAADQQQSVNLAGFFAAQDSVSVKAIAGVVTQSTDHPALALAEGALGADPAKNIVNVSLDSTVAAPTLSGAEAAQLAATASGKADGTIDGHQAGKSGRNSAALVAGSPGFAPSGSAKPNSVLPAEPEQQSGTAGDPRALANATAQNGNAAFGAKAAAIAGGGDAAKSFSGQQLNSENRAPDGLATLVDDLAHSGGNKGEAATTSRASGPSPQALAAQLNGQIQQNIRGGAHHFTVQLNPAELGRVEIKLTIREGALRASVVAERAETLDLLQQGSRTLERLLGETGLKFEQSSLDFSLRQDGGGQAGSGGNDAEAQNDGDFAQALSGDDTAGDNDDLLSEDDRLIEDEINPDGLVSRRV